MYTFPKVYSYTDGSGSGPDDCDPPSSNWVAGEGSKTKVVCLPPEECDPPPGECERCEMVVAKDPNVPPDPIHEPKMVPHVNDNYVERCEILMMPGADGKMTPFPPGTNPDTHKVDLSVTYCSLNQDPVPCPIVPRNDIQPPVNVGINQVTTLSSFSTEIHKTGEGTLVLDGSNSVEELYIYSGLVVINNPETLNNASIVLVNNDSRLRLSNGNVSIKNLVFGTPSSSYTSSPASPYQGIVEVGLGSLTITEPSNLIDHMDDLLNNNFIVDETSTLSLKGTKSLGSSINLDNTVTVGISVYDPTPLEKAVCEACAGIPKGLAYGDRVIVTIKSYNPPVVTCEANEPCITCSECIYNPDPNIGTPLPAKICPQGTICTDASTESVWTHLFKDGCYPTEDACYEATCYDPELRNWPYKTYPTSPGTVETITGGALPIKYLQETGYFTLWGSMCKECDPSQTTRLSNQCLPHNACSPPSDPDNCERCQRSNSTDIESIPIVVTYTERPCEKIIYGDIDNVSLGKIYPQRLGTSPQNSKLDTSVTYCPLDGVVACPPVLLAQGETNTILDIPENSLSAAPAEKLMYKKGKGTLIINSSDTPIEQLIIESGRVILKNVSSTNDSTTIILSSNDSSLKWGAGDLVVGDLVFRKISGYPTSDYFGKVDVSLGGITIKNPSSIKDNIRDLMKAGRNKGGWDGPSGFTTTQSVNGIKNIGYRIQNDGSLKVKWAIPGDITLDGRVNSTDITLINNAGLYGTNSTNANWYQGDFNYDGRVNSTDITLINNSIGVLGSSFGSYYLPKTTSFNISWNPSIPLISGREPIAISTSSENPDPYRVYEPEFYYGHTKYNQICEITDVHTCNSLVNAYYSADAKMCYDSACSNQKLPNPNYGACCIDDSPNQPICQIATFEECFNTLQGNWQGYNTLCGSQTCAATQQIRDSV